MSPKMVKDSSLVSEVSPKNRGRGGDQTTVNKKAPIRYTIPIDDWVHRPL